MGDDAFSSSLASDERMLHVQMGVYKDFQNMAIVKTYTPKLPVGATPQAGLDGSGDLFSNDQPVQFDIQTSNNGECLYF